MRFQSTAPYLAVAAVAVAAVVLYAAFAGPPVGNQDASPTPSATATPSLRAEARFEVSAPGGRTPRDGWVFGDPELDEGSGLVGYGFGNGDALQVWGVTIFLDPKGDYLGTWDTSREDLAVGVDYFLGGSDKYGDFRTVSDECQITFEEFTETAAIGSLDCSDIPGTHTDGTTRYTDKTVQLTGTFAFNPSAFDPLPTEKPVVSEGTFEITTPLGSQPSSRWYQFDVYDGPRGVSDPRLTEGLRGYAFSKPNVQVTIYLDPDTYYVGSLDTTRENLVVAIEFTRVGQNGTGFFVSTSGECRITFDEFTPTVATGSLDCKDVPMNSSSNVDPPIDGVAQLSGTFTFDPSAEPGFSS